MITMRDVADKAGVSRSTVSFVLNNRAREDGTISDETRLRVLEVASELGYRRNELARAVSAGKSRMIGLLTHQSAYEPVARVLEGALIEAENYGYTLKVLRMQRDDVREDDIRRCVELRLAGVIVMYNEEVSSPHLHQQLLDYNIPVAIVDNTLKGNWEVRVLSDDREGCRLAIEHLASLGHRRIACISGAPHIPSAVIRAEAYREAMTNLGLAVPANYVVWGGWEIELARIAVQQLLQMSEAERPTAIFCAGDLIAAVAMREARKAGLRVPEQLSVVGYANFQMAEITDPPLTTVVQPFEEMGRVAVRHLLGWHECKQKNETVEVVSTRLVVRESTAPAPTES